MNLTIRDMILEARDTLDRYWFLRDINIVEQTHATVTLHLIIGPDLFVQVFSARAASG